LPDYRCDTVRHRGRVTLYLSGEIDQLATSEFLAAADSALATGPVAVIVDLADGHPADVPNAVGPGRQCHPQRLGRVAPDRPPTARGRC
jgi:hypothetical protein